VTGVVKQNLFTPGVQHLVPRDKLTKDQLVRLELDSLTRTDVNVSSVEAPTTVDRTLSTNNVGANLRLFAAAGYLNLPTIAEMVENLCSELAN
jgi:hypothetical protein